MEAPSTAVVDAGSTERLQNRFFDNVKNLRDLGGLPTQDGKIIKPGTVFRSARLDLATDKDIQRIKEDLQISTIVDLRDANEVIMASGLRIIHTDYPEEALPNVGASGRKLLESYLLSNTYPEKLRRYNISLIGPMFKMQQARRAPNKKELARLFYDDRKNHTSDAVKMIAKDVLNPGGIIKQYSDFIDYCQSQIAAVLQVLATAKNKVTLFHCTHGKDRTGVIAALALACCGVKDEDIVADYALSDIGLVDIEAKTRQEICVDKGLNEEFMWAKADTMDFLLKYIRVNYGGYAQYLEEIGFTREWQQKLREKMLASVLPAVNSEPEKA